MKFPLLVPGLQLEIVHHGFDFEPEHPFDVPGLRGPLRYSGRSYSAAWLAALNGRPRALRSFLRLDQRLATTRALLDHPCHSLPTFLYRCGVFGATRDSRAWAMLVAEKCLLRAANPLNGFNLGHGFALRDLPSNQLFLTLVEHGVDLEQRSHGGWAPLHYAAVAQNIFSNIADLLVAGANPNAETRPGALTPAHVVAAQDFNLNSRAILDLHNAGADLTVRDSDGMTPRAVATHFGNTVVLDALDGCGVTE